MPHPGIGALLALALITAHSELLAAPVYADTVVSFQAGPQNIADPDSPQASFGAPADALGPPDGGLVSLGERGQITVAFDLPITDGPGPDLRVFENPFSFTDADTGETFVFAELAFVEVSTDGEIFARFPTFSPLEEPIGSFGIIPLDRVEEYRGLAGFDAAGDPFDLADLASAPVVQRGQVDLGEIRFVRIRDVIGDGSEFDGLGDPIFDPWPSDVESSGFDLDAVSAVNVVPEAGTLTLLALALAGLAIHRIRLRC
jgi:hypothetical protein